MYDFDAIDAAVRELYQVAQRAQVNFDDARQARLRLNNGAAGASVDASQAKLFQIEQVNLRIIDAVEKALGELGVAINAMATLEQQTAANYH